MNSSTVSETLQEDIVLAKPMPEKSSLPAIKNTDDKDKFAILVEDLRSLSTEQYNYVENIISNLIKLAKEKPMPEKSSLPAIKSTDVKDKFEILVEGLWSRSTEEYNCVENIISNLIELTKEKPMPEKSSLPEIKSTDVKDKFEILVERFWPRPTEEYNYVEITHIIINPIQLAEKKPMPEKSSLPEIKSTDVEDKSEIVVERWWERSTEEYSYFEITIL